MYKLKISNVSLIIWSKRTSNFAWPSVHFQCSFEILRALIAYLKVLLIDIFNSFFDYVCLKRLLVVFFFKARSGHALKRFNHICGLCVISKHQYLDSVFIFDPELLQSGLTLKRLKKTIRVGFLPVICGFKWHL